MDLMVDSERRRTNNPIQKFPAFWAIVIVIWICPAADDINLIEISRVRYNPQVVYLELEYWWLVAVLMQHAIESQIRNFVFSATSKKITNLIQVLNTMQLW